MKRLLYCGITTFICAAVLLFCASGCSEKDFTKVILSQGTYSGVEEGKVLSFKGLPYAKPPVGELRWRAPQSLPASSQTVVADTYGNRCMQRPAGNLPMPYKEKFTQPESEDCLYLNIYRPAGNKDMSLDALRAMPAGAVVAATNFASFIELAVDGVVIPDNIEALYRARMQARIPLLLGANDFEFGMVPPEAQNGLMTPRLPEGAMDTLVEDYGSDVLRDTFLYSDFVFHSQLRMLALLHEEAGQSVFVYRFGMPGTWSKTQDTPSGKVYGSPHAADLPYVFGNFTGDHSESVPPSERQLTVSSQMMDYWVNFARNGNPNHAALPDWSEYSEGKIMLFNPNTTAAVQDPWIQRLDKLNGFLFAAKDN